MVLYIQALRENVENFVYVATVLKDVLERGGLECSGYDEGVGVARENLRVLDGLLAVGITELKVPENPR